MNSKFGRQDASKPRESSIVKWSIYPKLAQRRSLFSLYLAYFADYFSWGVAIAYLAIYIGTDQSPFHHIYWRPEIALGIAMACFPIGEVVGSPLLGDLSDSLGRRKILIGGTFASMFSLTLCALSLWWGCFPTFLLGQFLAGFFSGKQAMTQAAIAEIDAETKSQKLAFLSVLGGLAWITGPYVGNLLLGDAFVQVGGLIWPSFLAAAVCAISLLCTYFFFEDTYRPHHRAPRLHRIGAVFRPIFSERLFGLFLLNLLGWYLLLVSVSYYFIQKFNLSNTEVGILHNYIALLFTLGGIISTAWILHRFRARKILFWMQTSGSFALLALLGSSSIAEFWIYLAVPAITEAIIYPAYQTIISDQTSDRTQGKVFGLIHAINSFCQLLSWSLLAILSFDFVGEVILVSALLFLISAAFFIPLYRGKITAISCKPTH